MDAVTTYDYTQHGDKAGIIQGCVERIQTRMRKTAENIIEIGTELTFLKSQTKHGEFAEILDAAFGWSDRTARNYRAVARMFGGENGKDCRFGPSVLYLLASDAVADEVIEQAAEIAATGEVVTVETAKRLIQDHREECDDEPADEYEETDDEELDSDETPSTHREQPAAKPVVETDRVEGLICIRDEIVSSFAAGSKRYDAVTAINKAIDFVRILQGN